MLLKSLLTFTLLGSTFATSLLHPREPAPSSPNPPPSVVQDHQQQQQQEAASRRGLDANGLITELDDDLSRVQTTTNAKRLVAGLPLLPPRRRHHHRATPTSLNVARSVPSQGTGGSETHGYIAARLSGTDTILGYVKNMYNIFGEHMLNDGSSFEDALKVILPAPEDRSGPFDLTCVDPIDGSFPFIGLFKGYASTSPNLSKGSSNYVFFGGVTASESYSTPQDFPSTFSEATGIQEPTESAVWGYEEESGRLSAQWINEDSSIPDIVYGYFTPDSALVAMGDKEAFEKQFGKVQEVELFFVPA